MGKVGWGCRSYLITFSVECMCGGRAYYKLDFHLLEKISRKKTLIRAILSESNLSYFLLDSTTPRTDSLLLHREKSTHKTSTPRSTVYITKNLRHQISVNICSPSPYHRIIRGPDLRTAHFTAHPHPLYTTFVNHDFRGQVHTRSCRTRARYVCLYACTCLRSLSLSLSRSSSSSSRARKPTDG